MIFSLTEIIAISFPVALVQGLSEDIRCDMSSGKLLDGINGFVECNGFLFQHVCLICSISSRATDVRWYGNNRQLTQDEYNLQEDHAGGIEVNRCDSERYSLRLKSPSLENDNTSYSCVNHGVHVSQFVLKLKAETKLFINSTRIFQGKLLGNESNASSIARCVIEGAVPPFSLTWSLNGVVQDMKTFNYSAEVYSFDLLYDSSHFRSQNVATCSSQGKYIRNDKSLSFHLFKIHAIDDGDDPFQTDSTNSFHHVEWILIPSAGVILAVIVLCLILKGVHNPSLRLDFVRNRFSGTQVEDVGNVANSYYYVEHFANGSYAESGK
ncbi:hypothetical protein HOLleu_22623 [Holothuria leucospilota]|uniref:Ig-like domain-containing protein n=1 Tax=Holothuria leucospilota TaxID=206669 RepID=A0A9Q1H7K5_HOLLE|nr:hypothetical protein HOLleu_22623 [Holothuria leucospilota]